MTKLHLRAAAWCEQAGQIADAIRHALAAEAFGWAARIIAQRAEQMIISGQIALLRQWLDMLSERAMPTTVIIAPCLRPF